MPEAGARTEPARPLKASRSLRVGCALLLVLGAAALARSASGCLALDPVLVDHVRAGARLAETWLLANQRDNGLLVYRYDPARDHVSGRNNALRQLMASRTLARIAARDPAARPAHRRNLEFVLRHWYRVDDEGRGHVLYDDKSKLGANAVAIRALLASPDLAAHGQVLRQLVDGVLSLQASDGGFRAWLVEPDYAYDEDYLLTFYSGEAILALHEYATRLGDDVVLAHARRAIEHYRARYVDAIEQNFYPAYVPWHTFALDAEHRLTADPRHADAVLIMNDRLLTLLDRQVYRGRFHNPRFPAYGRPHVASDGVYTESLVHAHAVAERVGDVARARAYRDALDLALRHLVKLQYRDGGDFPHLPEHRLRGALRTDVRDPAIRLDNVQHALDAFEAVLASACEG
ncbi:MAG: hypothetical protein H6983_07370 [Ectothiorhodospiraceae bacterium]|nr:hypothetical protein [Ectothiorhodospiraceae bacterium]